MSQPEGPAVFRKEGRDVPSGYFAWEAAGLRWLAAAEQDGGAAVVPVLEVDAPAHTTTPTRTPAGV